MAQSLLTLPHEVLHGILYNVDAQDLAALRCCRALNDFIGNNRLLFKEVYLKTFDPPLLRPNQAEPCWDAELRKLTNVQKILKSNDVELKNSQLETVAQAVQHLISTAAPALNSSLNIAFLLKHFESPKNRESFFCSSSLYQWAKAEAWGAQAATRLQRECRLVWDLRSTDGNTFLDLPDIMAKAEGRGEKLPTREEIEEKLQSIQGFVHNIRDEPTDDSAEPSKLGDDKPYALDNQDMPCSPRHHAKQLSAKLHVLYGVPMEDVRKDSTATSRYSLRSDTTPIHPYARSRVYDLRQHTEHTIWGPFMNDGTLNVDWEKMEAIMIILNYNMKRSVEKYHMFEESFDVQGKPFGGVTAKSFVSPTPSLPMQPSIPLEARDPYNITGTWMRIVCFLDYTELYDFNFNDDPIDPSQPRKPIDSEEATRLITMKLQVSKIAEPEENDGQELPVAHFKGYSSSVRPFEDPNANSKIRGTVRLTKQGEVRWTSISIFHGEERWASEGIQVGGVRSARGVLGYWFDKDYDEYGPAGPTSFWKAQDGIEKQHPGRPHSPLSLFTMPMY